MDYRIIAFALATISISCTKAPSTHPNLVLLSGNISKAITISEVVTLIKNGELRSYGFGDRDFSLIFNKGIYVICGNTDSQIRQTIRNAISQAPNRSEIKGSQQ